MSHPYSGEYHEDKQMEGGRVKPEIDIISIRKVDGETSLKAWADIRVFGCVIITRFGVIDGKRGLFVSPPRVLNPSGRWVDVVVFSDLDIIEAVQEAILNAYSEWVTA